MGAAGFTGDVGKAHLLGPSGCLPHRPGAARLGCGARRACDRPTQPQSPLLRNVLTSSWRAVSALVTNVTGITSSGENGLLSSALGCR